jgi:tetratricopeptide (TPR) repeat protein
MVVPGWVAPADFLLLEDRLCRPPLQQWANGICRPLKEELGQSRINPSQIASLINLAALVEALRGDAMTAKAICQAELVWLASLPLQQFHRRTIAALALQPWINIGRVLRIEEEVGDALDHFTLALKQQKKEPIFLGPFVITSEDWYDLAGSDIMGSLWNIYLVDSLKSFFRVGAFDDALEFIRDLSSRAAPPWNNLLLEGKVISYAGIGDHEQAYWLAKSQRSHEVLETLVFILYQSVCLVGLNQCDEANSLATELTSFVSLGGLSTFPASTTMRYLGCLGDLLDRLGRTIDAASIYQRAYNIAVSAGDQPSEILFLLAREHIQPEDTPYIEERCETLLNECYYDEILRFMGFPGCRWSEQFGELRETVSMATSGALLLQPASNSQLLQNDFARHASTAPGMLERYSCRRR